MSLNRGVMTVGLFLALLSNLWGDNPFIQGHKAIKITFRITGEADAIPRSSFSPNRQSFIAEMTLPNGSIGPAKVEFRFMGYEDVMPKAFVDSGLRHTFMGQREPACDENWHSFSTKQILTASGEIKEAGVVRSISDTALRDIQAGTMLPCYVISRRGYRKTQRLSRDTLVGQTQPTAGDTSEPKEPIVGSSK
jgi:hypothetical protein